MTLQEAKAILHPDTSNEKILEIQAKTKSRYEGIEIVNKACILACECIDKVLTMEDDLK